MERLTKWKNGHAYYPRCFENPCYGGGCVTRDCLFETEICERLAAYEDTGMTPQSVEALKLSAMGKALAEIKEFDGVPLARLRELAAADKEGRVAVLPFTSGRTLLCEENIDCLRLMKDVGLAIRYCTSIGIVFYMGYDAFCDLVKHGRITAVSEEAERAMEGTP